MSIDYKREASSLLERAGSSRFILGIVGPPGAGKSTIAEALYEQLEEIAPQRSIIVPMDGFHLDDATLKEMGLHHLKGIPDTFDAEGFISLLTSIRQASLDNATPNIPVPLFDRAIESTIQNGRFVRPSHQIILVEGNYLLLNRPPWHKIRQLCDETWYLDVPENVLTPRLIDRHMDGGKSHADAVEKANMTDLPNARLVNQSKHHATRIWSDF
ncbi:MAG: nucleoside triphosphate hydrolase [Chloroflexota bacterium]